MGSSSGVGATRACTFRWTGRALHARPSSQHSYTVLQAAGWHSFLCTFQCSFWQSLLQYAAFRQRAHRRSCSAGSPQPSHLATLIWLVPLAAEASPAVHHGLEAPHGQVGGSRGLVEHKVLGTSITLARVGPSAVPCKHWWSPCNSACVCLQ